MVIDISKIVNDRIQFLSDSGQIQEQIEKSIEKTVIGSISSALEDYSFKRSIEKQVSDCVSDVAKNIGFSAYNGFIAQKIKEITENVMRDDVAAKIQKVFDDLLIARHDGIKLSEIFNQYRDWVCESTEESDKWEHREFVCDLQIKEDGKWTHCTVKFNDRPLSSFEDAQIEFSFCMYGEKEKSNISRLKLDGRDVDGKFTLGILSKIETLLANLYFNKTEIILDFDDVDEDNSFDIDC